MAASDLIRGFAACFRFIGGNEGEDIGDFQVAGALLVELAQRKDVGVLVPADSPDMRADKVLVQTADDRAINGRVSAEFFPMFQPRTATADGRTPLQSANPHVQDDRPVQMRELRLVYEIKKSRLNIRLSVSAHKPIMTY